MIIVSSNWGYRDADKQLLHERFPPGKVNKIDLSSRRNILCKTFGGSQLEFPCPEGALIPLGRPQVRKPTPEAPLQATAEVVIAVAGVMPISLFGSRFN